MSLFDRLEGWLERGIEGLFGRRSDVVQPIEIGRKLTRLMEEQKQVSVSAVYAPNSFLIRLSPPDYARLTSISPRLSEELGHHLTRVARRQGYALVGQLVLTWNEAADLPAGTFQAETSFVAAEDRPEGVTAGEGETEETTVVFRRSPEAAPAAQPGGKRRPPPTPREAAAAETGSAPQVSVVHGPDAGRTFRLRPGENRVGRAEDNDIVLGDTNVSRYHAALVWDSGTTRLRDLGSRNGTRRNGELVEEAGLAEGDELQIGLNLLAYRER